MQKLEKSLDYYKTKYDDYSNITEMNKELTKALETLKNQNEDLQKKNDISELKISKYIEKLDQIQVEKLNLELEISKNNSELLRIKQEISEFHEKLLKKDARIFELQNKLENIQMFESNKGGFFFDSPPKNLKNELNGLISEISEVPGNENGNAVQGEKIELLIDELQQKDKEMRHLMEKCKELQKENGDLLMKIEKLNEEVKKVSLQNKNTAIELKKENKKLGEEVLKLNQVKNLIKIFILDHHYFLNCYFEYKIVKI